MSKEDLPEGPVGLVGLVLGMTRKQFVWLASILWVLTMTVQALAIWGLLSWAHIPDPHATVDEVTQLRAQSAEQTRLTQLNSRVLLARELREMIATRCATREPGARSALGNYIEWLQEQYAPLNNGQRYPETCQ